MKPLQNGMNAPDFSLKSPEGIMVNLKTALTQGPAVIIMLPDINHRDTADIVDNFRDDYNEFTALRANLIPIIRAEDDALVKLKQEHELQFSLFGDPGATVFKKYGALDGLIFKKPKKYGCVVDRSGTITRAFRSVDANKFSRQALYALRDQMGRSALRSKDGK
jgi:peroxiredoxin